MEKERFIKLKFQHSMHVTYQHPRLEGLTDCMLLAIDFDNEVVKLLPFPNDYVEEKEFWCSIDYFELPKKKLKIIK